MIQPLTPAPRRRTPPGGKVSHRIPACPPSHEHPYGQHDSHQRELAEAGHRPLALRSGQRRDIAGTTQPADGWSPVGWVRAPQLAIPERSTDVSTVASWSLGHPPGHHGMRRPRLAGASPDHDGRAVAPRSRRSRAPRSWSSVSQTTPPPRTAPDPQHIDLAPPPVGSTTSTAAVAAATADGTPGSDARSARGSGTP